MIMIVIFFNKNCDFFFWIVIWGGRFEVLMVLVFCLFIYLYSGGGEFRL